MPYSAKPPGLTSRLKMITSCPANASFCAANRPAGPAPTTKTVAISVFSKLHQPKGKVSGIELHDWVGRPRAFQDRRSYLRSTTSDEQHTSNPSVSLQSCSVARVPCPSAQFIRYPRSQLDAT